MHEGNGSILFCFSSDFNTSNCMLACFLACLEKSRTVDLHDKKGTSDIYRTKWLQNLYPVFVGNHLNRSWWSLFLVGGRRCTSVGKPIAQKSAWHKVKEQFWLGSLEQANACSTLILNLGWYLPLKRKQCFNISSFAVAYPHHWLE